MTIKCTSEVVIIEVDGKESKPLERPHILVHSAWNWIRERVVLEVDGHKYTVVASDLIKAVQNATNCGVY